MNKVAKEITERLNLKKTEFINLINSGNSWQGDWTKLLKTILTEIGHEKGYFVSTSGIKIADEGEWLFDLVWSELYDNGNKTMVIDIPLVLESEISVKGFGGFKTDFDKLFFATNSLKIFVTKNDNESVLAECIDYAQSSVNINKNIAKGEGIYLIVWQEIKDKDFELIFIESK